MTERTVEAMLERFSVWLETCETAPKLGELLRDLNTAMSRAMRAQHPMIDGLPITRELWLAEEPRFRELQARVAARRTALERSAA